jgi:hypothetical protein
MSGGKGGSQTTTAQVQIPAYIEEASKANLARANEIAQLGSVADYGPVAAAFTPSQEAAFQGTADAASAFGIPTMQVNQPGMTSYGMPQPTQYAGGVRGYSSAPIYEQSVEQLRANAPAQYDFIRGMFINPQTGERPATPFGPGGSIYPPEPEQGSASPLRSSTPISTAQAAATRRVAPSSAVTEREMRMGLTPEMKARGMTIADMMG